MAFALGELGWTPEIFYKSSPLELKCASKGYFNKYKELMHLFRASAFITYRSMGGKKNIDAVWPVSKDVVVPKMTSEMMKKIKEIHGLK